MITVNCLQCGKEFETWPCKLKNNRGKFCNRTCLAIYRGKLQSKISKSTFFQPKYKDYNPNFNGGKERNCIICNKVFWNYPSRDKKTCSTLCGRKSRSITIKNRGSKHPAHHRNGRWGLSYQDYKILRDTILELDNHSCRYCSSKSKLQIHHIEPRTKELVDNSVNNLISLCVSCHKKIENPTTGYSSEDKTKLKELVILRHSPTSK